MSEVDTYIKENAEVHDFAALVASNLVWIAGEMK